MLKANIEKKLNYQINRELYSSYLYLSMSSYLKGEGLDGYANWFKVQAEEERDHALIIYNYVHLSGGTVVLDAIEAPPAKFDGVRDVLAKSAEHEALVTGLINDIVTLAQKEKDHKTSNYFMWFVDEQVEEEDNAATNLKKYDLMGSDGKGLYLLDQELASRVYKVPSPLATAE
ncbi:MAG: ferritin [Clostridia bacterium]|nr:ferritin [Clostridia bacterium]